MNKILFLFVVGTCVTLSSPSTWAADAGTSTPPAPMTDAGGTDDTGIDTNADAGPTGTPPGYFSDGGVNPSVAIDAAVTITAPREGETFTSQLVSVTFNVTGCEMSGPSSNPTGCHIHRLLDGQGYSEDGESKIGHYNANPMSMIIPTSGPHTIKLVLHRNDGTDLAFDPEISDEVNIVLDLPEPTDEGDGDDEGGSDTDEDEDGVRKPEEGGCGCDTSPNDPSEMAVASVLGMAFVVLRRRRRPRR